MQEAGLWFLVIGDLHYRRNSRSRAPKDRRKLNRYIEGVTSITQIYAGMIDAVLAPGDLVEERRSKPKDLYEVLDKLSEISTVVYATGNHDHAKYVHLTKRGEIPGVVKRLEFGDVLIRALDVGDKLGEDADIIVKHYHDDKKGRYRGRERINRAKLIVSGHAHGSIVNGKHSVPVYVELKGAVNKSYWLRISPNGKKFQPLRSYVPANPALYIYVEVSRRHGCRVRQIRVSPGFEGDFALIRYTGNLRETRVIFYRNTGYSNGEFSFELVADIKVKEVIEGVLGNAITPAERHAYTKIP